MSEKSIPTYADFVRKLFNRSGDLSKDYTHAILGVVTEIHEYLTATDEVNGLEELGDLAFYIEALAQVVFDATGERPVRDKEADEGLARTIMDTENLGLLISNMSTDLLDSAKRWVGYGKQPPSLSGEFNNALNLVSFVNAVGPFPSSDLARIKAVNMAKLLKRYPGGEFDAYRAVVRDLDGERAVLESH